MKQDVCTRMERSLDRLADFTTTRCWRARDREGISLLIVAQLPVFSLRTEKAWLLLVMLLAGHAFLARSNFKADRVLMSDAARMSRREATAVSPATLRSLRQRLNADTIDLDAAYAELLTGMQSVSVADKPGRYVRMPDSATMPELTQSDYNRLYAASRARRRITRELYPLALQAMVGRGDFIVTATDTEVAIRPAATPELISCRVARKPKLH